MNRGRDISDFAWNPILNTINDSLYNRTYEDEYHFKYAVKSYKLKYYYPDGNVVEDNNLIKNYEQKKELIDNGLDPNNYMSKEEINTPEIIGEYGTFYMSNDITGGEFDPLEINSEKKDFFISGTYNGKNVIFDEIIKSDKLLNSDYSNLPEIFKREIVNHYDNYIKSDNKIKNLKFAYYGNLEDPVFKSINREELRDNTYIAGFIAVIISFVLSIITGLVLKFSKIKNSEKLYSIFAIPIEVVAILFFILFFCAIGTTSLYYIFEIPQVYYFLFFLGCFLVTLTGLYLTINLKSIFSRNTENILIENSIIANIIRKAVKTMSAIDDERFNSYKFKFLSIYILIVFALLLLFAILRVNIFGLLLIIIVGIVLYIILVNNINDVVRINRGSNKIVAGDYKSKIENNNGIYSGIIENFNNISSNLDIAVEDALKSERLKTELITNVSHDLKTPLTSIINYSDLLSKEGNSRSEIREYSNIINEKSNKLKVLIEDLFEVSKATSNNIELNKEDIDLVQLVAQSIGEWEDKISEKNIEIISKLPDEKIILNLDGQKISRVLDNLFSNISKYALENTRVYIDLENKVDIVLTVKNISKYPLDITPDELMERFTRGEKSRTTSGSGLGLSIASSFVRAHGASFNIDIDGDLFKITIVF